MIKWTVGIGLAPRFQFGNQRLTQSDTLCQATGTTGCKIQIGIDSFSYHCYLGDVGPCEQAAPERWDSLRFLARTAELAVQTVSLQPVYLPRLDASIIDNMRGELDGRNLTPVLAGGHPRGLAAGQTQAPVNDLLCTLRAAQEFGCWLVRIAFTTWLDEDAAVAESVAYLGDLLAASPPTLTTSDFPEMEDVDT